MQKRIEHVEEAERGSIIGSTSPDIKADFLATLLDRGMPEGTNKSLIIVRSNAIVKRFGQEYDGFELCYFGLPEPESDIRTGIPIIKSITANGTEIDMVVWARMVSWRDAKAYFINFYDAKARYWRMMIARQEMDKATKRAEIGHKLIDGMKLAFAQFEGFSQAARATREDEISKETFRNYLFNQVKKFAGEYPKLNIKNLLVFWI
jgi:hypothetical protein